MPRPAFAERKRIPSERNHPDKDVESYVMVADGWKLIRNADRPEGWPEFELYSYLDDPLDHDDVAAANPEVVQNMAAELDTWLAQSIAVRVEGDATTDMSPEEISKLRSLGYIQ